jgi:hypothetical protein
MKFLADFFNHHEYLTELILLSLKERLIIV